ncbi:MAG: hypothetical protein ABSD71_12885 [Bacteroidales bacterium]|jgi:DUF917 family protein
MAISFKNVITRMYSGRVGDIVLRNYGGKSVMAKRPDCSKVVKSEAQLAIMAKFAKASKYSKAVKNDPQRSEDYSESKKKTKYKDVFHAAMSDCLTKPKVQKVDLTTYRGHQGNVIRISAWDKFRVETVSVMILNKMGQLIEKGPAVAKLFSGNREWDYIATVENADYKSCRILVRVKDRPGNVVEAEVDINGSS